MISVLPLDDVPPANLTRPVAPITIFAAGDLSLSKACRAQTSIRVQAPTNTGDSQHASAPTVASLRRSASVSISTSAAVASGSRPRALHSQVNHSQRRDNYLGLQRPGWLAISWRRRVVPRR